MSCHSVSIVPKKSNYYNGKAKAKEILEWLVTHDIVKETLSDCALGSEGYAISEGARKVAKFPDYLPYDSVLNGLEIVIGRQIFDAGENGLEGCICPYCKYHLEKEVDVLFEEWFEQHKNDVTCPNCYVSSDIHDYKFLPEWGFSNLGFTFWNWSEFTEEFVTEFKNRLGCEVSLIYTHR